MMRIALTGAALVLCAAPLLAETTVERVDYLCERETAIPVVYVNDGAGASEAILLAEGKLVLLSGVPTASGARYAGEAGVSGYTWWSKGGEAMLGWFDADHGEEVTLFAHCLESGD